MLEICYGLTLGSAGVIFGSKKPFGRYQRKRPLFHGLWVYVFYLFPSLLRISSMSSRKEYSVSVLDHPCFSMVYYHELTTQWRQQWRGLLHGTGNVPEENVLPVPFGRAFEVKDGNPSPTKSHWKFPALGPSVPMGSSVPATPQESVFIKTSRLKLGRVCKKAIGGL